MVKTQHVSKPSIFSPILEHGVRGSLLMFWETLVVSTMVTKEFSGKWLKNRILISRRALECLLSSSYLVCTRPSLSFYYSNKSTARRMVPDMYCAKNGSRHEIKKLHSSSHVAFICSRRSTTIERRPPFFFYFFVWFRFHGRYGSHAIVKQAAVNKISTCLWSICWFVCFGWQDARTVFVRTRECPMVRPWSGAPWLGSSVN